MYQIYKDIKDLRRKHYRLPVKFSVEFQVLKYQEEVLEHLQNKKGVGVAFDLGLGGMSFISHLCLPIDMLIRAKFQLENGTQYRELARVVRTKRQGNQWLIGVKFIHFTGFRREKLTEFIEDKVKKSTRIVDYI